MTTIKYEKNAAGDDIAVDDLVYHSKSKQQLTTNEKTQDLTEQWKNNKLEEHKKYYCKTKWFEDIFQARCYDKDTEAERWSLENEKYKYNNIYHTKDIKVLALVPSFEELEQLQNWADFTNDYHELREKLKIAEDKNIELKNKMYLERQLYKYVLEENDNLKELLKYCHHYIINTPVYPQGDNVKQVEIHELSDQILSIIGESYKDDNLL